MWEAQILRRSDSLCRIRGEKPSGDVKGGAIVRRDVEGEEIVPVGSSGRTHVDI